RICQEQNQQKIFSICQNYCKSYIMSLIYDGYCREKSDAVGDESLKRPATRNWLPERMTGYAKTVR
ncbi:MAG: hypothetical protein LBR73_08795, partial [Oscillospiraceae bacterium]|nr:hypothetical protein [Oscillospiraceae bacterium]